MECLICSDTLDQLIEQDVELLFPICSHILCEKCLLEINPQDSPRCPYCGQKLRFLEEYQENTHDLTILSEAIKQMTVFQNEIIDEKDEIQFLALVLGIGEKEEIKTDIKILDQQCDDVEKFISYLGNTPPGVNISLQICLERVKDFMEFPKSLLVKSSTIFHKGKFRERPFITNCKVFGGENLIVIAVDKNGKRCKTGGDITPGTDCENGIYILDKEQPFINNFPFSPRLISDIKDEDSERNFSNEVVIKGEQFYDQLHWPRSDPILLYFLDETLITNFGELTGVKKYFEIPNDLLILR